jgi:hypothetical protein
VYTGNGFRGQGKVVVYTGTKRPSSAGGLLTEALTLEVICSLRSPSVRFSKLVQIGQIGQIGHKYIYLTYLTYLTYF